MNTTPARPVPRPPERSAGTAVVRREFTEAERVELRRRAEHERAVAEARALVASWKRDTGHDQDQAPGGEQ